MERPHTPMIKVLQVPNNPSDVIGEATETVLKIDQQSLRLVVQALNLVAAEHSARAFIPTSKESTVQHKIAQLIENGMNEALRGARR